RAALALARYAVFPAPAGINRQPLLTSSPFGCVPRASGDKPAVIAR
ncbi:hypothetical protein AWE03_000878, partial [Escherichia coli]